MSWIWLDLEMKNMQQRLENLAKLKSKFDYNSATISQLKTDPTNKPVKKWFENKEKNERQYFYGCIFQFFKLNKKCTKNYFYFYFILN